MKSLLHTSLSPRWRRSSAQQTHAGSVFWSSSSALCYSPPGTGLLLTKLPACSSHCLHCSSLPPPIFTFSKAAPISWLKLHCAFQVPLSSHAQFHAIFHILPNNLTLLFYYFMILRTSGVLRTGIGKGQYHISLMTVVLTLCCWSLKIIWITTSPFS